MELLSRIATVLSRQDFRMSVSPESDDTDIVLEDRRDEIEPLRAQLAKTETERDDLIRAVADHVTARGELAAQNQQMRRALTYIGGHIRLSRLFACEGGDSYDPECADLNIDKAESFANEALALPVLADVVLNREISNFLREAATHWSGDGNIPEMVVKLWLDDMADAIEKGEPNK